jgi:hypothetical protein
MTNLSIPNVLNGKALEKQLKLVEIRLQELQVEMDTLHRIKDACTLLLGTGDAAAKGETADSSIKKGGPDQLRGAIEDLLRQKAMALTVDEVTSELKELGVGLPEKKAQSLVVSTLKKYPELFAQTEDEKWMASVTSGENESVGEGLN